MFDETRKFGSPKAWQRMFVLCTLLGACTPVASPVASDRKEQSDSDAGEPRAASDAGEEKPRDAGNTSLKTATMRAGESCEDEGARACTRGNPSRQPLQCSAGTWREQEPCTEGQRCSEGECVKLARECVGRTPEEKFCDGDAILSCSGGVSTVLERCAALQRCVEQPQGVECNCQAGMAQVAGQCVEAVSCDEARGGCDPLTECSMRNGERECSACPDGFAGAGLSGCTPVLASLGSSVDGALTPAFSSAARSYRLRLSMVQAQVVLRPVAAARVKIEINGAEIAAGAEWRSDVLGFGETPIAVALSADNGLTSRYEIIVERAGAEEAFIKAMYPEANDTMGYSVAISGDTIAVSATSEDGAVAGVNGDQTSNGSSESGAVYIFVREGSTWRQEAYIKSDRPEEFNYFGGSVALDGDTLLVGEPRSTPYPTTGTNAVPRPGVVHVYTRSQGEWSHTARIESPSSDPDLFGYSVAISEDTAVIGAPYDSANGRNSGAIYSLPRGGAWGPLTRLSAQTSSTDDVFGWSVTVQRDRMLVGAPAKSLVAEHVGKVVAYTRANGTWTEQQTLVAEVSETGGCYGWSVALRDDMAVVGSPYASLFRTTPRGQAFIYQRIGDSWQLAKSLHAAVPRDSDYFGASVALAGDAVIIAASGDSSGGRGIRADPNQGQLSQSGAFYLFGRRGQAGDDWVQTAFVKTSNAAADVSLGQSIAVSGDTIVVGATNESTAAAGVNGASSGTTGGSGAVYVFR